MRYNTYFSMLNQNLGIVKDDVRLSDARSFLVHVTGKARKIRLIQYKKWAKEISVEIFYFVWITG